MPSFGSAGTYNGHQWTAPLNPASLRYAYKQHANIFYETGAMHSNPLRYGVLGDIVHRTGALTSGSSSYIETRDAVSGEGSSAPVCFYAFNRVLTLLTMHPAMSANASVLLTSGAAGSGLVSSIQIEYADSDLISMGFDLAWLNNAGGYYSAGNYYAQSLAGGNATSLLNDHYDTTVYPLAAWCLNTQRLRHISSSYQDLYLRVAGTITSQNRLPYRPAFFQNGRILIATSGSHSSQELDAQHTPGGVSANKYHYGDEYLLSQLTKFDDVTDWPDITPGTLEIGPDSQPVLVGIAAYSSLDFGVHRTGDPDAAGVPTTGSWYQWNDPLNFASGVRPIVDIPHQITDAATRSYWEETLRTGGVIPGDVTETIFDSGSDNFEVPAGKFLVIAEGWGGGAGGGGGKIAGGGGGGSGGSGGGYFKKTLAVTPGDLIPYVVGAGGAGGAGGNPGANGANGGDTTLFGGTYTAEGGNAGLYESTATVAGGAASGGDVNTPGGAGSGASANVGGSGGSSPNGGASVAGTAPNGTPLNGNSPGGGGPGGAGGVNGSGAGAGAAGRVKFTY